jgi:hypothetical protein
LKYSNFLQGLIYFSWPFFTAALLKLQKERQERRAKEEEERRERERQEAEELVRRMHEDACDDLSSLGAGLGISEGHIEADLRLPNDLDPSASCISPVSIVRIL